MLAKFRQAKQTEIAALRAAAETGSLPQARKHPDFAKALCGGRLAVIAEYKRASPSKGVIRKDLEVEEVAAQYRASGAAAMSVLTEESFFDGSLAYLERASLATDGELPLLRKDFIFDPLQIDATAATPAAAILLIARMYADAVELRSLIEHAQRLGLGAVVEVFAQADLAMARAAGAKLIQVNARDLDNLQVNRNACLKLIAGVRPLAHEIWIAASGIDKPEHLAMVADAGFQAALVGSGLMRQGQPGENLAALLKGLAQ